MSAASSAVLLSEAIETADAATVLLASAAQAGASKDGKQTANIEVE
jgi:hypothetical protein